MLSARGFDRFIEKRQSPSYGRYRKELRSVAEQDEAIIQQMNAALPVILLACRAFVDKSLRRNLPGPNADDMEERGELAEPLDDSLLFFLGDGVIQDDRLESVEARHRRHDSKIRHPERPETGASQERGACTEKKGISRCKKHRKHV